MAACNIPSTNTDPQYRYKMPKIVTKIEGSGIGIKTRIVNLGDVANALKTSPQYLVKWFAIELGTQVRFTHDGREGENAIIKGARAAATLQSELDQFIEKYVICHNCGLPEIEMYTKSGVVKAKCSACGKRCELDNSHKLAGLIVKQFAVKDQKCQVVEKSIEDRKQPKRQKQPKLEDAENSSANRKHVNQQCEARKDKRSKGGKKEGIRVEQNVAVFHPQEATEVNATIDDSGVNEVGNVIRILSEFVSSKGEATAIAVQDFFSELRAHQVVMGFDNRTRLYIVFEALFGATMTAQKLKQQQSIVDHVILNACMPAADVLWALNVYLGRNPGITSSTWVFCLKVAYDEDWCDEADILHYYNNQVGEGEEGFAEARAAAAPFLQWLAIVDSDSGDDLTDEDQ